MQALKEQFEGNYSLRFNLAPPLLSRRDAHTGVPAKREFGPWMFGAFRLLAPLKRLRGTVWDVFGYTAERRRERQDIADYEAVLERHLPAAQDAEYAVLRELLALPLQLRGFGHVKDRNRARLALRRAALEARLAGDRADSAPFVDAAA